MLRHSRLFYSPLCVECAIQREPELEFGAIYRAKIVEIRQVLLLCIFHNFHYCASGRKTLDEFCE